MKFTFQYPIERFYFRQAIVDYVMQYNSMARVIEHVLGLE